MRRAALAEIALELKGRDQRGVCLLDLACGNGRFLRQIAEAFPRLQASGLDLSPHYIARARRVLARWSHVELVEGAAESLPFPDASIDIIVCIFLFHELPAKIRVAVINEAARVLRPGGVFIVADSLQFGDNPKLDAMLEYFPEGFHEPYYRAYLDWDFNLPMQAVGFARETRQLAFMTKVQTWRKS